MTMKSVIPAVPLPIWKDLYSAALEFQNLEPWRVLGDMDLVGVRDPSSGEASYGVVMGSGGTLFGFCLYRGADGFKMYRRLIFGESEPQSEEIYAMQNCLKVEFGLRNVLRAEDLGVIHELGLTFKGKQAWPEFRSLIPGYVPWFLTAKEAQVLTFALNVVCHHCERVRRGEVDETFRDKECLVYSAVIDSLTQFDARWEPWPTLKPTPLAFPVLNLTRINAILAKKPKPDSPWEADVFYSPSTIDDRERPYFTRMAVVCQQVSAFAFAFDIFPPETSVTQALSDTICAAVEKHSFLPETIFVKHKEVVTALTPLGKALGVAIRPRGNLETIQLLQEEMKERTMYGRAMPGRTGNDATGRISYQMKVTLRGLEPRIWRRFLVPGDYTLEKLHRVLQVVMGWENYHLHEFKVGSASYGQPDPEFGDLILNDKKVTLQEAAPERGSKISYIYDFGDGWQHDLKVEKILAADEGVHHPLCVAGKRACPPEDCGGIGGYIELLKAIRNPVTEEQRELVEWAGDYDPEAFDPEAVNKRLRRMK